MLRSYRSRTTQDRLTHVRGRSVYYVHSAAMPAATWQVGAEAHLVLAADVSFTSPHQLRYDFDDLH